MVNKNRDDFSAVFDGVEITLGKKWGRFCWWGFGQIHKWRWNVTHIDLGPISIYGIKHPWVWLPLAWLIKPLRILYHRRFKYGDERFYFYGVDIGREPSRTVKFWHETEESK